MKKQQEHVLNRITIYLLLLTYSAVFWGCIIYLLKENILCNGL